MKRKLIAIAIGMALSPAVISQDVVAMQEAEKKVEASWLEGLCGQYLKFCTVSTSGNGGGTEPPPKKPN